jgi:hypothetical protein
MTSLDKGVTLNDFHAYMPMHNYIFAPTRETWPASSINARLGSVLLDDEKKIPASTWLDQIRHVEQMTWAPGKPTLIHDELIDHGGWIARKDVTCFNLYRPPTIELGDPTQAGPWVDHGRKVYPDDADPHHHVVRAPQAKAGRQDQSRAAARRCPRHEHLHRRCPR